MGCSILRAGKRERNASGSQNREAMRMLMLGKNMRRKIEGSVLGGGKKVLVGRNEIKRKVFGEREKKKKRESVREERERKELERLSY